MLLFDRFYSPYPARPGADGRPLMKIPPSWCLVLEGGLVAGLGMAAARFAFPEDANLVGIFLASVGSVDSIERLLMWNRHLIQVAKVRPFQANLAMALRLAALFLGAFVCYSLLALTMPVEWVVTSFSHQLPDHAEQGFAALQFPSLLYLIVHNLHVLLFFFLLAIPFRQGGVMLVIAWNASAWGGTFGVLARRWSDLGGPEIEQAWLITLLTCGPHMLMEALAYSFSGLAGVFLGKGFLKYYINDGSDEAAQVLFSIIRSILAMLGISLMLVLIGAGMEAYGAPELVALFVQWASASSH